MTKDRKDKILVSDVFMDFKQDPKTSCQYKRVQDFIAAMRYNSVNTCRIDGYNYLFGIVKKLVANGDYHMDGGAGAD